VNYELINVHWMVEIPFLCIYIKNKSHTVSISIFKQFIIIIFEVIFLYESLNI